MDERRQAPGATAGADLLLEQDGPVAGVTFNRPEARNAMTFDMYEALHDACERFDRDPGVRVVVLRGAGERAFASGTDIRQFLTFKTREDALGYEARVSRVLSRIAGMTKPTLAMVQGDAVGGGLFMALACDLRLAAPHARFGAPVARTLGNFVAPTSLALLAALVVTGAAAPAQEPRLTLPQGFRIDEFAAGFGSTRFMAIDPAGTLLVSTPNQGRVVALPDRNRDGRADSVVAVLDGLDLPHGLAFKDGLLYVAETGRVKRFRYDPATLKASDAAVVVPTLPPGGGHWTRTIAFGPDGRLYVSVGSACNVCRQRDPRRPANTRYHADGSGEERFATGLRNAVGLAFHPRTGELWATVNERDWRGDDLPPDYITEVKEGGFYGWPDCFAVGGRAVADRGANGSDERCRQMTLPPIEIQGHSAPLALAFYTGSELPPRYPGRLLA